jgi:rod shape-determining protein MreC
VLALICALGLIIADHRFDQLDRVRAALSVIAYPLQWAINLPATLVQGAEERLASAAELRALNRELTRENLLLQVRLQKLESLEAENMRLRDLLGSSLSIGERVLIAEILAVDLTPSRHQVIVNKGTSSDVFVGQAVLDANAVMGQVIRTSLFSSIVLLITDSDHALPVEINRNGLRSIAAGTGIGHELTLLYIPKNADVMVGDLLVTSGVGERFPPGYPVARVSEVRQDPDNPFMTVLAEPTARLDRSREVLLVWTTTPLMQQQALTGAETSDGILR